MQRTLVPRAPRPVRQRSRAATALLTVAAAIVALAALLWLGLQVRPAPYPSLAGASAPSSTIALPTGLPTPVERFYRTLYGERIPVVTSAVVSGLARMRVNGVVLPARFRFTHLVGRDYRHDIEATLFGLTLLRVEESYLDGRSRIALPFGVSEGEPKIEQAANLGLWAEAIWFPSAFLTDPRVSWEAIDDESALLSVPFGEARERFVVRFDPESGLITTLEAMRYREADSTAKTLWLNRVLRWGELDGAELPLSADVTWFDEGRPWATFHVDEVATGLDVARLLRPGNAAE